MAESRVCTEVESTEPAGLGTSSTPANFLQRLARQHLVQFAVLLALLTIAALRKTVQLMAFASDSTWLHLRTGAWILHNHAVPHTGLFSQSSTLHWVDLSWLYDAWLGSGFALFGLKAIPLTLMLFKVALAAVTFLLAGGWRRFWTAVALSAFAQWLIVLLPLPVVCSICLFGLALHLMLQSRRRGDPKFLLLLPPLYWFWANLDAQFLFGLLLLAVFLVAEGLERLCMRAEDQSGHARRLPFSYLLGSVAASFLAVLLTPNLVELIPSAWQSLYGPLLFKYFGDMSAMDFRHPEHFGLLLLAVAAAMSLGRQRSRDLFKIILLLVWATLGIPMQRDSWTVVLVAIAIVGDSLVCGREDAVEQRASATRQPWLIAVAVATLLAVGFLRLPAASALISGFKEAYPAKACEYIRSNHLPGPIFNEYQWSGYLSWTLPEYPVAMDSRLTMYGDEQAGAYFEVISGARTLDNFAPSAAAQTFLLQAGGGLGKALTEIPVLQSQFHEVYRDNLAVVIVRK